MPPTNPASRLPAPPATLLSIALLLAGLLLAVAPAPAFAQPRSAQTPSAAAPPWTPPAAGGPTIGVGEVVPGQKGYGLSVFAGGVPERFEVEVIGVVENMRPGASYILAHLSGQGLEKTGVIAGMSGSPVYFDGRLAGAVAFSWDFSEDAIAGITPIADMRALVDLPASEPGRPVSSIGLTASAATATARSGGDPLVAARSRALLGDLWPAALASDDARRALQGLTSRRRSLSLIADALAPLRQSPLAGTNSGLGWVTSGFSAGAERQVASWLGGAAAGGTTATSAPVVPGGSVAAVLVDGDYRLAVTGTVTDRQGDAIVAFGHPFLGQGPMQMPLASAQVVTVIPSLSSSFKLANLGPRIGVVDEDRQAGIRGRLGVVARTVPVAIRIGGAAAGAPRQSYRLELANLPSVAPGLLALSIYSALDAASHAGGTQEIDLVARLDLGRDGVLDIRQSFDGNDAGLQSVLAVMAYTDFLLQNEFADVTLASVDVELTQHPAPRAATLVAGYAERSLVHPGDTVGVTLELVPYRGEPFRERLDVALPASLPAGRYSLLVGDGSTIDGVRLAVGAAPPERLGQALSLLRSLHSRRQLVVLGVHPEAGLTVAGEVLPQLPGSLRALWKAAGSRSATPLALALDELAVSSLEVPVDGGVRIDLVVERRLPETGEDLAPTGADALGGEAAAANPSGGAS